MRIEITADTLDLLDQPVKAKSGVVLSAKGLTADSAARVFAFVMKHGNALERLSLDFIWAHPRADGGFSTFDFTKGCPMLEMAEFSRLFLDLESLLGHPSLTDLSLRECTGKPLAEAKPQRLESLDVTDSRTADRLLFGHGSAIRSVSLSIDEDYSEYCPRLLEFDGCGVQFVDVRSCSNWTVRLKGMLPALRRVDLDCPRYGGYDIDASALDVAGSSEYARSLLTK